MPKVVVVGGFLGAGKTSLILNSALRLRQQGLKIGIVTNDQSSELIDTRLAAALGFSVGEVAGGCFCCRFSDLLSECERIHAAGAVDVVFAEPVGSCTDIIATVIRPLAQLSGIRFAAAPFSVVVDPTRDIGEMNELVGYLYRRQLAEADIVVVSKLDLASEGVAMVKNRYSGVLPEREVFGISAVTGAGIDAWLQLVLGHENSEHSNLSLDYQKYTDAEASLGWLNLSANWHSDRNVALIDIGEPILWQLQRDVSSSALKTAHVKLMLSSNAGQIKGSFTSNHGPLVWDKTGFDAQSLDGDLVLNARAQGTSENLSTVVKQTLAVTEPRLGLNFSIKQLDCFSPSPPKPTYRINNRGASIPLDVVQLD